MGTSPQMSNSYAYYQFSLSQVIRSTLPGEAGTKHFAGKSESQNSKSETTQKRKAQKMQSGLPEV
jgi:hypothetical protein